MSNPFSHPSSDQLLGKVSHAFKTKKIYQRNDRHIVFLCGGPVKPRSRSMRKRFLRYSQKELPHFRFFLAEAAAKDLIKHNAPEFINVAEFEILLVEISDCIILFPESAGSIAEAGFFSNSGIAIKKLFVINDVSKQSESFINTGIFDWVNSKSDFRAVILTDFKNPVFNLIKDRLNARLPSQYSKIFEFDKFSNLSTSQKLFISYQIIFIFKALRFETIVFCIESIFKDVNQKIVKHLLSILIAVKYIRRVGDDLDFFAPSPMIEPFLEFRNFDQRKLQARIIDFYKKYHLETYELIKQFKL